MSIIARLTKVKPNITAAMGAALVGLKKPTRPAANAPNPICSAPNKADALPASFVKGAIANAEEFGKQNPWQDRNRKIKVIVLYKSIMPVIVPVNSSKPSAA